PRSGPVENSTDRFGGDYRSFEVKNDDKAERGDVCRDACQGDNKCRAWTFARPGYAGRGARCFLKNDIKPPRRRPGFISGVVR
ncbi:MAG: PAN domain-containing protein, partial [Hyphomicrobiales bacterium]|nr:PAN domain-containing protein [Hyphomicrobiales bacterium]